MSNAHITVLVPVYNAERTLQSAITSVLEQTYDRFELVAIDDGSTDSSPELLAELAKQDARITIIRTSNCGVTAALNTGLESARGDLVARMDADDICEPLRFEKQVTHLAQHESCIAVGCRMILFDDNGSAQPEKTRSPRGARVRDRCNNFRHFPPSPPTIPHPTAMIRLSAIKRIGGYRPYFKSAQDRDLWWRLSRHGELHCLPDRLLRQRRHESAVSLRYPKRSVADSLIADLSAIACYFEMEDVGLLEEYGAQRDPSATIQRYAHLLGERYPVERLANFRAITRGHPSVAGHKDNFSALQYSIKQLLRSPLSPKSYKLVSASLSLK